MDWNWQHPDWPGFRYRPDLLAGREAEFLRGSRVVAGAALHIADDERLGLSIELAASEALKTSEIEGEILDRDSVQSSLRWHFGLQTDGRRVGAAEQGSESTLVAIVLPSADQREFGSREMLYTAITRSRPAILEKRPYFLRQVVLPSVRGRLSALPRNGDRAWTTGIRPTHRG